MRNQEGKSNQRDDWSRAVIRPRHEAGDAAVGLGLEIGIKTEGILARKKTPGKKPGPKPERLKIDEQDWTEAVRKVVKKERPPEEHSPEGGRTPVPGDSTVE
jgi:hypothetical protein